MQTCGISWRTAIGAIAVAFVLGPATASAVQIVLSPAAAIGGSGAWDGASITNPWDVGGAEVGNVFDSQGPGPKFESPSTTGNAWLGNNGDNSEYFVIDLGASYVLQSFDLFNSHNGTFNDRAVRDFRIEAANAVAAPGSCETGAGTCGLDLSGPTAVLVGPSVLAFDLDPINAQTFAVSDTSAYRYVRFVMLSTWDGIGGGLNEMQVFGTAVAPEPGSLLLLGSGLLGLVAMGRRGRA